MSEPDPAPDHRTSTGKPPTGDDAFMSSTELRTSRAKRRQEKVVAEVLANRRGEYKVPTWVLTTILLLIIGGLAAIIIFG